MPCPGCLVVKNGSKAFSCTSRDMPQPVSLTAIWTYCADRHGGVLLRVALVDEGVAGLDGQLAPAGHGVLGIDHEIEDRGLHLARIDLDLPQPGAADDLEIDVLAERPPEEIRHAADQLVDVGQPGIERLAPREGQQPLRQHRRALRAAGGIGDRARKPLARRFRPRTCRLRSAISRLPLMMVSRLLKSCATPPVSWPIASIFCE